MALTLSRKWLRGRRRTVLPLCLPKLVGHPSRPPTTRASTWRSGPRRGASRASRLRSATATACRRPSQPCKPTERSPRVTPSLTNASRAEKEAVGIGLRDCSQGPNPLRMKSLFKMQYLNTFYVKGWGNTPKEELEPYSVKCHLK